MIFKDTDEIGLGYEGSHIYKINGKYYVFNIHWPSMRSESCFVADSLTGEFTGKDVLADDMGYLNQGVAQGGIIDTPDGKWYAVLFRIVVRSDEVRCLCRCIGKMIFRYLV